MGSLNAGLLLPAPYPRHGYCGGGPTPITVSETRDESDVGENRISKLS